MNPELALKLRAKKLGILMRDARLSAGKTMKECGTAIGVSGSTISSYEKGASSPSLPELEQLAFFLKVPISKFWADSIISAEEDATDPLDLEYALAMRDRQVGEILQNAREKLERRHDQF